MGFQKTPAPAFYREKNASDIGYSPAYAELFAEAAPYAKKCDIKPSGADPKKVHLLLLNCQRDFCFPGNGAYVGGRTGRGAMEDNAVIARFIYENLSRITEIICCLSTHFPYQICFPSFWQDKKGEAPKIGTQITLETLKDGSIKPNPAVGAIVAAGDAAWLSAYSRHYVKTLPEDRKLVIQPYHALLGSQGHSLAGVIEEARLFHCFTRKAMGRLEMYGGNPLTESESVLATQVLVSHDGRQIARRNVALVDTLLKSDALIVAGQASSHAVRRTLEDLLVDIKARDPKLAKKVYILKDAMSAVAIPDGKGGLSIDATGEAERALGDLESQGMHLVESLAPMSDWEGFPA